MNSIDNVQGILIYSHSPQTHAYAEMLRGGMSSETTVNVAFGLSELRRQISTSPPRILHILGAWHWGLAAVAAMARKHGLRYVYTPMGQLEPWIMKTNYWKEKLPKRLLFQRRLTKHAYAILAMGPMEQKSLLTLGWNPRVEVVYNPLVTQSIHPKEACRQTMAVYRKVCDTNTIALMKEDTRLALRALIKAGQTHDAQWLTLEERQLCSALDNEEWRKILIYAADEGITGFVNQGMKTLGLPPLEVCGINNYRKPENNPYTVLSTNPMKAFHAIMKLVRSRQVTLRHVVEYSNDLRKSNLEEDRLIEELEEHQLTASFQAWMQVLKDLTGLEDGLMPLPPKSSRMTRKIEATIKQHLEV